MFERVAIVGAGWAGFRPATPDQSYKELMYAAAVKAYADAGVDPRRDIQSFISVAEDFHEGTSIFDEYTPDQVGAVLKPMHTIAGDGLHGLATAVMLIQTGQFDLVAVESHSKASNMLTLPSITAYAQDPVLNRPLGLNTHFIAGMEMNRYLSESGTTRAQCAAVAVKNKANALLNPRSAFAADYSIQDIVHAPMLAWPLGTLEAAQHCDGAIVLVLAAEKLAVQLAEKPVWVLGLGWCNGSAALESRAWGELPYVRKAGRMAYRQAGISSPLSAIDFLEIDDTYAYRELQTLEALGFSSEGSAGALTADGYTAANGDLPVNVSGGSLGVGHLLDATGLERALEAVLQLRGEAGASQLDDVQVGLVESWRGVPTTSAAVAILSN